MRAFMDENFLLETPTAVNLYHKYAKNLPVIDYHCHINQNEILSNRQFSNLTQVWLEGDHYKWRAMRSVGIEERFITGDASDYQKFQAWARTVPQLIGNPLYHWTHLELRRYFAIDDILNEDNAKKIWLKANDILQNGKLNVRDIIAKSNVELICTTDDPTDDLLVHRELKTSYPSVAVLPAFRPDRALSITNAGYLDWLKKLELASDIKITDYQAFQTALESRIKYFNANGCTVSDHGLNYLPYAPASFEEVTQIFANVLSHQSITANEEIKFRSHTLIYLGKMYHKYDWTMQYHMNVTRNNNSKMLRKIGPDSGFDAINDSDIAYPLSRLLDEINETGLPRTILYSLNPKDNHVLGTIMGAFQDSSVRGKIQLGSAWWFNDQRDGMVEQMKTLANLGAFASFIGMLTDSRSFLSYTRHEYFRRILCNLIATWVENGEYPNDESALAKIVQDICYYNAKRYFKFG